MLISPQIYPSGGIGKGGEIPGGPSTINPYYVLTLWQGTQWSAYTETIICPIYLSFATTVPSPRYVPISRASQQLLFGSIRSEKYIR